MRKLLAALALALAALIPAAVTAGPSLARAVPHTCTATGHDQVTLGASKIWLTNVAGCPSGYPVFYNRTACVYKNVIGTFWYDGPQRKGNGSSTSNYSGVTCNQYPYPSVVQVWIWINYGGGYQGKRLF